MTLFKKGFILEPKIIYHFHWPCACKNSLLLQIQVFLSLALLELFIAVASKIPDRFLAGSFPWLKYSTGLGGRENTKLLILTPDDHCDQGVNLPSLDMGMGDE